MMKKNIVIPLIALLMMTMACAIGYEGISIGSDPDIEKMEDMTATAANARLSIPEQTVSTPVPAVQPAEPQAAEAEPEESAGAKEYSVTATNFDCTCQVDGNVTVEYQIKGDQLEFTNAGGGVDVYDKIGENTYKRSWMGYYILVSGTGDEATETKVEEERSVVIILNDGGYVMEHYQGSSAAACCFHTFTQAK